MAAPTTGGIVDFKDAFKAKLLDPAMAKAK